MSDTQIIAAAEPWIRVQKSESRQFFMFLIKLSVAMFVLRSFFIQPFFIPSESMMPRLLVGDYLIVSKWPFGYSRYSLPGSWPLGGGRLFAHLPERGDVVVFKTPQDNRTDYVKRVIGLPGDTIQMRDGIVILNGLPIPKQRVDDLVASATPGQPCLSSTETLCHFPRYRETLPNGRSYEVLDLRLQDGDNTRAFSVPADHLFLMGDNRDNSEDSRIALAQGGVGYVPLDNVIGRAQLMFYSWDANGDWAHKIRWNRIGGGF